MKTIIVLMNFWTKFQEIDKENKITVSYIFKMCSFSEGAFLSLFQKYFFALG